MFYQADKINNISICKICENKIVDPRILPCGRSVCHRCVDLIADTDKKRIKCQHCGKIHEIPDDGFLKNLALQELLECEAKEVLQSNHIEEFKKFLDILNATKQSIESTLECGDATIRDHCDKVRNAMQLAIEQAHAKLDEIHKDFMDEIDNHEKECQAKFKSIQQNKVHIEKALNDSNELLSKSNQLLKQFKIDQTELTTLLESGQSLLSNLEQIKDGIQIGMFNETFLKFEKQSIFDSSVIGKIIKQNIELYFLENIENMREFEFCDKIKCTSYFPILQPFKSDRILFLYLDKNILNLFCLDKDGNTLFEKRDLPRVIKNQEIEEIKFFRFCSSFNNKVFICTEEKHLTQKNTFSSLRSYDENINLLAKIKLDKKPKDYEINGENLFLFNINENFCTISMYNHNLEMIQIFGQENPLLSYFCSTGINRFLVCNQYFIINELAYEDDDDVEYHNSVTILNRSNGLVQASFKIYEHFNQMRIYLNKFLITFNNKTCFLKCHNFKGDLLHKITLDKKFKRSDISVINKELCFVLDNYFSLFQMLLSLNP
jgi:hypothetical protein